VFWGTEEIEFDVACQHSEFSESGLEYEMDCPASKKYYFPLGVLAVARAPACFFRTASARRRSPGKERMGRGRGSPTCKSRLCERWVQNIQGKEWHT
jgi:hypothetical protein